ncbi:MAG: PDZ domain-containing protein [Ruminococcus sp.]|nr:PDZ domain-containing protein [Ruminococcus sp.]
MKNKKIFLLILGFACSAGLGAGGMYLANYKKINFMNRYPLLTELEDFAKEDLGMTPPEKSSDDAVIDAYFRLYDDKYTVFIPVEDSETIDYAVEKVNNSETAKDSGFRVRFNENEEPYFSAVVSGMPADKQGIRVGDIIKKIDGKEIKKYKNVVKLTGDDGKKQKLTLERDGEEIELDFVCVTNMDEKTGVSSRMYGKTQYIAIESISSDTAARFKELLNKSDFDSIIIDLRGNFGGYIQFSVEIADNFIGESETVMHGIDGENETYETTDNIKYDVPIVVLVNENTASAAEILTALLKQYGDATLVGTTTFGKGIYQDMAIFKGNNVKYTHGYYTVGDWECYQGIGIEPDIEVDMDPDYIGTDKDIQLQEALKIFSEN